MKPLKFSLHLRSGLYLLKVVSAVMVQEFRFASFAACLGFLRDVPERGF